MRLFSDLGDIIRVSYYSTVCAHNEVLRHSLLLHNISNKKKKKNLRKVEACQILTILIISHQLYAGLLDRVSMYLNGQGGEWVKELQKEQLHTTAAISPE